MKVAVFGLGAWGFCLARHIALLGHQVRGWDMNKDLCRRLRDGEDHPHLFHSLRGLPLTISDTVEENLSSCDLIVESVTMKGMRPFFHALAPHLAKNVPLVLTSKGIEQKTQMLSPRIAQDVFGEDILERVSVLSGPSFAEEVANKKPTAVSLGVYNPAISHHVVEAFSSPWFRVYPNKDIIGVSFGGAMKNVIAIACGVANGLRLGSGASAALVTRGLHEMVRLASAYGCETQTLYGLSGLGDLYLTCSSNQSRNFRFGMLLSQGLSQIEAEKSIGMVVEGANTCTSALDAAKSFHIPLPITQGVVDLISKKATPQEVVEALMNRSVKEETQ